MITDTHCHLYEDSFDDLDQVFSKSESNGVIRFVIPNVDSASISPTRRLIENYSHCHAAIGLHPTYVNQGCLLELDAIKKELDKGGYVAVGEVGMDLYWSKDFVEEQKMAFETQIRWAIEADLPLIVHSRDAFPEVFEVLEPYKGRAKGVFHSFTGGVSEADRIVNDFDFYVGVNGVVTYKSSDLKEVLKEVPLSRVLLETDSPYLSPVPHRGRRNDPSNLPLIAAFVAQIYEMDTSEFEDQIEANVSCLFAF